MKLSYIILSLIILCISFASALNVNIPTPLNLTGVILNASSNDSYFLRGLTPQQVANLFTSPLLLNWTIIGQSLFYPLTNPSNFWNVSSSNWIYSTGNIATFNESKLSTTYYNATQSSVVKGTIDGGTLTDTQHEDARYDGVTFNFSEESGSPGLDLRINFTGIDSFNQGVMRYKSSSLAGTYPIIQMWNYDTSSWEDYPAVAQSSNFATITQPVFDSSDHVSGGVAQMRIYKASNGNTNNHYYVDWIAISKGFGTPAGEEIDPYFEEWVGINNNTLARTGNCPAGQVVTNTTNSGVQCVTITYTETDPIFSANLTNGFSLDLLPNTNIIQSLGSLTKRWLKGYFKDIDINGTIQMNQGNITNMSYIINTEINGACDLTKNHSRCSNVTGTYIIG